MGEILKQQETGFTLEQLTTLRGLRVMIKPEGVWREAMENGPETVEVPVARIEFDEEGEPVAFGVRHSAMLQTITEHGDPTHNSAERISFYPNRVRMYTADGQDLWFPPVPKKSDLPGDPFDVPYI